MRSPKFSVSSAADILTQINYVFAENPCSLGNSQFLPDHISLNTVRLREKGKREKAKFKPFPLSPLPFSQTTREMKISYPNRIDISLASQVLSIQIS